jgi:hypothetical protein
VKDEHALSRPPSPPVGRLDSLKSVRQEMVRIYREGRLGSLDTQDMTRFVFVLQAISRVIEQSDLETRMTAIEAALRDPDASNDRNQTYPH